MRKLRFTRITAFLALVLTLCGYCVSGNIPGNSRQGVRPVSAPSCLENDLGKPNRHPVFLVVVGQLAPDVPFDADGNTVSATEKGAITGQKLTLLPVFS